MGPRIKTSAVLLTAIMTACQGAELPDLQEAKKPTLVVKYHPNGMRAEECSYLSGQRHGLCMTWDEEGHLLSEGRFVDGLPEGAHYARTRDGRIYRDYRAGLLDGLCTLVTREGIVVDTPYHLGVPHGRLEARSPTGLRVGEMYFDHGELHGRSVMWHDDGTLMESGYFEHGQAQGFWTFWDKNGELSAEGSFVNGKRHGYWVLYRCCGLSPLESYCDLGQPEADCASNWLPMAKMAPRSVMRWCND